MKKIIILLGVAILTLTSCSTENETPVTNSPEVVLLVKRIIGNDVSKIVYDGSKIVKIEKAGSSSFYTYTGNIITKITSTEGDKTNITELIYENGRLTTTLKKTSNGSNATLVNSSKKEFIYDMAGNVTIKKYYYSAGIPTISETSKITIKDGNIVRVEHLDASGTTTEVNVYEYDTRENPISHTAGYIKLVDPNSSSKNNILKTITTVGSGATASVSVTTNVFILNNYGYPLSVRSTRVVYNLSGSNPQSDEYSVQYEY